jgi:hypothetical protein
MMMRHFGCNEMKPKEAKLELLETKLIERDLPLIKGFKDLPGFLRLPLLLEPENVFLALYGGLCLNIISPHEQIKIKNQAYVGTPNFMMAVFNEEKDIRQEIGLNWLYSYKGGYGESILLTNPEVLKVKTGISAGELEKFLEHLQTNIGQSFIFNYQGFKHLFDSINSVKDFCRVNKSLEELFKDYSPV